MDFIKGQPNYFHPQSILNGKKKGFSINIFPSKVIHLCGKRGMALQSFFFVFIKKGFKMIFWICLNNKRLSQEWKQHLFSFPEAPNRARRACVFSCPTVTCWVPVIAGPR